MYNVSDAFLAAVKQPVVDYILSGSIDTDSFSEANIVKGSFKITNQCTDTSDVVLGSVYVGQLEATFTGLEIAYTEWIGKQIIPMVTVYTGPDTSEGFLLGKYTIAEAKHAAEGVQVVAYDNMMKFDKKFKKSHFRSTGTPISIAQQICIDCGVTFANTQEEIETFANWNESIDIFGIWGKYKDFNNDIDTYRDLLFWCAQTMGCFATINRDGNLVFRKYTNTIVDTISESHRLSGATFADYITNYTGIYVADMRWGTESYYGYDATALTAEIALVNTEMAQVESDLVQVEIDYAEGRITEEEYKARKKELTNKKKQLQKRLNWLNKALAKAQAGADGSFMDLGENPMLQDKTYAVRERQRRAVLKSLDLISYTPFQCDSIFGAHYDLGDVIYFTGGHAGSEGVFCCIMGFEFGLNDAYTMQGWGVNPSLEATRNLAQKTATMANANAMTAKEVSSGYSAPASDDGKEDDVYVKYGQRTTYTAKYPMEYHGWADEIREQYTFTKPGNMATVEDFEYDELTGYYSFHTKGNVYGAISSNENDHIISNGHFGDPVFQIHPTSAGTYKFVCDAKWNHGATYDPVELGFSAPTTYDYIGHPPTATSGASFLSHKGEWHHYEWERAFSNSDIGRDMYIWLQIWFPYEHGENGAPFSCEVKNLRMEKVINVGTHETDTGVTAETDHYVDKLYVNAFNEATGTNLWREISFLSDVDSSEFSGLEQNYRHVVKLTPEVVRAWFKADPPQIKRDFNQLCIRFTGDPDNNALIDYYNAVGWTMREDKKDGEGVYNLKSGGSYDSETVQYIAYKLSGLTMNSDYYFNFAANFSGATFGDDYDKGLGLVFNTTGSISTDDWTGDPHTFNPTTKYCSFYRTNNKRYYNFGFTATASTMYMILTTGDITGGTDIRLELSSFVLSKQERKYARNMYIFDTESETWLSYKPFGSKGDGETVISTLGELDDVELDNLQNGQALLYDLTEQKWKNESLGTAAGKDYTQTVTDGSTDLPTAGAVKDAIDAAVSSVYKPSGTKTVAEMVFALLVAANLGNVYNMSDSGSTTADFVEGAGHPIAAGDNVAIVDVGTAGSPSYKFDLLSGIIDLSDYYDKGEVDDLLDAKVDVADVGVANGIAELDANGLVPSSQLPSYVDDVLEYASVSAFPATGETGKIYVALDTNLTYRWSGSAYVEISPSLALGETSSTAYRGDRGKTAYDHATESGKISAAVSSGFYKFGATAQGHIASTTAVAKSDLTALGVADQNDVDAIETDIQGYKTVTGKYITITDGAELPAKNYSITLSPVQEGSGDPSPSNVRPIHGADEVGVRVCGVNLWDEEWEVGAYDSSASTVEKVVDYTHIRSKNPITVESGKTYYMDSAGKSAHLIVADINGNVLYRTTSLNNGTFTVPQNGMYVYFNMAAAYGTTYNNDISINYPSTDTTYHAFNGHSTTITLPSTVYGGSVEQGGSGTSEKTLLDLGNLSFAKNTLGGIHDWYYFYCYPTGMVNDTNIGNNNVISDSFKSNGVGYVASLNDGQFCQYGNTLYFRYDAYNDKTATEFKTFVTGKNICFNIATPTSLSLTPFPQTILEGVNNVWAEMVENSIVIDNAQQSLSYQPQNIVGELRQEINAKPDSFAQLTDVDLTGLQNGQVPKWNSANEKWEPADDPYTLPTASASTKGGVKIGDNLEMNGEVLSAKTVPWTLLDTLGYNDTVAVPSSFSELMVIIKHNTRDCYSAIFPAAVADFSIYDIGPSLTIPVYYSGSMTVDSIACIVENVSDKYYAFVTGDQSATATLYYR